MNLLEVKNLHKDFVVKRSFWGRPKQILKAVNDVSFSIEEGKTLGLVGESGCGKSTTGRTIIGLYKPTKGKIIFAGKDISQNKEMTKDIQMIFQDPYASLNPRMTVADIIEEPLLVHNLYIDKKQKQERIYELLELVGLSKEQANRFPHEFSGGQRQRIGIARALACEPKLIICDEPISALDVSIQAQVVNLLEKLQHELGLTYLFIAHDLAMVRYISQKVAVMYLGQIVELADTEDLYTNPLHPYTKALLSSIPLPDPQKEKHKQRIILQGELPSPLNPPNGQAVRAARRATEYQRLRRVHGRCCRRRRRLPRRHPSEASTARRCVHAARVLSSSCPAPGLPTQHVGSRPALQRGSRRNILFMKPNYIFETEMEVRDYECDIQGIVNNANYLHYTEHTRHLFLTSLGVSFARLHEKGVDAVVARMNLQYKTPLRCDDIFVSKLGVRKEGLRYIFDHAIHRKSDGRLCFLATVELVSLINGKLGVSEDYDRAFGFAACE